MHEIAQNCVCNAQQLLATGAQPQTALGKLTALPHNPQLAEEWVNPMHRHLPFNAFGVSLRRLWRLKSNVPLPKQFSGSAPDTRHKIRCLYCCISFPVSL